MTVQILSINKSQKRLYLLRKLRSFDASRHLLQIVYKSLVESVLTFNIVVWYENLDVKRKAKLVRIVEWQERQLVQNKTSQAISTLQQLNGKLHGS